MLWLGLLGVVVVCELKERNILTSHSECCYGDLVTCQVCCRLTMSTLDDSGECFDAFVGELLGVGPNHVATCSFPASYRFRSLAKRAGFIDTSSP